MKIIREKTVVFLLIIMLLTGVTFPIFATEEADIDDMIWFPDFDDNTGEIPLEGEDITPGAEEDDVDDNTGEVPPEGEDITPGAENTEEEYVWVHFDTNGGLEEGVTSTSDYTIGTVRIELNNEGKGKLRIPEFPPFYKKGFEFVGWADSRHELYMDEELDPSIKLYEQDSEVNRTMRLYAIWRRNYKTTGGVHGLKEYSYYIYSVVGDNLKPISSGSVVSGHCKSGQVTFKSHEYIEEEEHREWKGDETKSFKLIYGSNGYNNATSKEYDGKSYKFKGWIAEKSNGLYYVQKTANREDGGIWAKEVISKEYGCNGYYLFQENDSLILRADEFNENGDVGGKIAMKAQWEEKQINHIKTILDLIKGIIKKLINKIISFFKI